jgi:hypothetical protein
MKKLIIPLILLASIALSSLFSGCYSGTVDAIRDFPFQFMVNFDTEYYNRQAPDTSVDFTNLYKYPEYRENADKIKKSEVLSFNYWINNLKLQDGSNFNPAVDTTLEFEFIRFYLQFARKVKPSIPDNSQNPNDWELDPTAGPYELGTFEDVKIHEYFRFAYNIEKVEDQTAKIISEALKEKPQFYILTEYGEVKGQPNGKYSFPYINARFDLDIRFEVELF